MPQSLGPIPISAQIVDRSGSITEFFRLRWQQLITAFTLTADVVANSGNGRTSALPTTTLFTTLVSGRYRVSTYLRKTVADGVSSSLQITLGWTETGVPLTKVLAALTTDTTAAEQDAVTFLRVDGATNLTIAIAYASNTPGLMAFSWDAVVEQMA